MNLNKLRRLAGDLNAKGATRRALGEQRRDASDEFKWIRNSIHNAIHASRHQPPGWSEGADLAALLKCAPADLRECGVDLRDVKRALELREQMADLQARGEALDSEIAPLSQLVDRLTNFVESQRG